MVKYVDLKFKMVYLDNNNNYSKSITCDYKVNPTWTLTEFIKIISDEAKKLEYFNKNEELEIVQAGQKNCEKSDSVPNLNIEFKEKYNLKTSFYIRKKFSSDELLCGICYVNNQLRQISGCVHSICNNCTDQCIRTSNRRCPFCRTGIIN